MPRVIDICCGRGGLTSGFLAEGWEARGYDIAPQTEYQGYFMQCDLLDLIAHDLRDADFVVCSTPCEQFSIHCMKHFHPNPPHPHLGITLFNHARTICEQSGKPYIMENVRCAERFIGKATNHCGPFYLWGNAVPSIFPPECYKVVKGMYMGSGTEIRKLPRDKVREYRKQFDQVQLSSRSIERKQMSASVATIPMEIARYVAQCAQVLIHD